MKRYNFIIAYDIADPKRLGKIARIIERKAFRIQYSVYAIFDATKEEVTSLLESVTKIYDEIYDDIRIYKIKHTGIFLGSAIDLENPFDFI